MERPQLSRALTWMLEAFWELSTDRQLGQGFEGHLAFSSIDRFARRENLTGDGFQRFRKLMRRLDTVYLQCRAEGREQARQRAAEIGARRDPGAEARRKAKRALLARPSAP